MGECVGCVKYVLFIFNFALWLLGCALLSVGIWVKVDDTAEHQVQQLTEKNDEKFRINYNVVETDSDSTATFAYVLIVFGIAIILITFIGCCGAVRENMAFLAVFAACLFVLTVSLIGVGIWARVKKDEVNLKTAELQDKTDEVAMRAVQEYFHDDAAKEFMETLQEMFHCCGARTENDYPSDNRRPRSCHGVTPGRGCAGFYFHHVGDEIESFLEHRYAVLAGVCIAFGICTGLGMAVTILLCILIRKASSVRVS